MCTVLCALGAGLSGFKGGRLKILTATSNLAAPRANLARPTGINLQTENDKNLEVTRPMSFSFKHAVAEGRYYYFLYEGIVHEVYFAFAITYFRSQCCLLLYCTREMHGGIGSWYRKIYFANVCCANVLYGGF